MCDEDLEGISDLSKGNARILLPVLYCLRRLGKHDEILALALEVDPGLLSVAASHFVECEWWW